MTPILQQFDAQTIARLSVTPADSRRARFLRLIKIVSLGDPRLNDGFPDFNRNIALDHSPGYMREIVGYTPIEADGSVRVKVPANISFKLEVTDGTTTCTQTREVHYVDAEGARERIDLARRERLGSVSLWALGFDAPATWQSMRKSFGRQEPPKAKPGRR